MHDAAKWLVYFLADAYALGAFGAAVYLWCRLCFWVGRKIADRVYGPEVQRLQARRDEREALAAAKWQRLAERAQRN